MPAYRSLLRRSLVPLVALLAAGVSGCELGNSFFHMDSNSPSPFFGFNLIPKKATTSLTPPPGPSRFVLVGGLDDADRDGAIQVR